MHRGGTEHCSRYGTFPRSTWPWCPCVPQMVSMQGCAGVMAGLQYMCGAMFKPAGTVGFPSMLRMAATPAHASARNL